jgi:hypothetical protein
MRAFSLCFSASLRVLTQQDVRWHEAIDLPCGPDDALVTLAFTTATQSHVSPVDSVLAAVGKQLSSRPLTAPPIPPNVIGASVSASRSFGLGRCSANCDALRPPVQLFFRILSRILTYTSVHRCGAASVCGPRRVALRPRPLACRAARQRVCGGSQCREPCRRACAAVRAGACMSC